MNDLFFSLDGVDGVGKSTQLSLLADWLEKRGYQTITCRDPGSTQAGEAVREILLERSEWHIDRTTEMLLYMAARAQLVAEVIRPALNQNKVVLADRFLLANVVYQGHAGGLDMDSVRSVGTVATGGVRPKRTIILDMDVDRAMSRLDREQDRMESQGMEFLRQVRQGFLAEAEDDASITVVDADQSVESLHTAIVAVVGEELDLA